MTSKFSIIAVLFAWAAMGCSVARSPGRSAITPIVIHSESPRADALWTAAEETLRDRGFRLDRLDRRAGIITSVAEVSEHFFEVWRSDVGSFADWVEAGINPIRRRVEINFVSEGEVWTRVDVAVRKERLSSPDRQFNSSGAALQFFGSTLPSTTGSVRVRAEDARWLDMGIDGLMSQRILSEVVTRAGIAVPADSTAGESTDGAVTAESESHFATQAASQ